jgi:hypothetical protein
MPNPWEMEWEVVEEETSEDKKIPEQKSVGGFLKNIPGSAAGVVDPFIHPLSTIEGLGKTALGGMEKMYNATNPSTKLQGNSKYFDAALEGLMDRYGSMEAVKETAYKDPVGLMSDIAAIISGGSALAAKGALGLSRGAGSVINRAARAGSLASPLKNPNLLSALRGTEMGALKTGNALNKVSAGVRNADLINLAGKGITNLSGPAARFVSEIFGATTGRGAGSIKEAAKATPEFMEKMRGKGDIQAVVSDMKTALNNLKLQRASDYETRLDKLSQSSQRMDLSPVYQDLAQGLKDFNIKVVPVASPDGMGLNSIKLDFSRSTITSATDQTKVKKLFDDLAKWGSDPKDYTPINVDILKRRLGDYYVDSSNARALVEKMYTSVRKQLSKVPDYDVMTRNYEIATDMIKKFESELSISKDNPGIAIRKIANMFSQNSDYRQSLVEALNKYSGGKNLSGEIAGVGMQSYAPSGIVRPIAVGAGVSAAAGSFINPQVIMALMMTSPRIVGELAAKLGQGSRKIKSGIGMTKAKEILRPEAYRSGQYARTYEREKEEAETE